MAGEVGLHKVVDAEEVEKAREKEGRVIPKAGGYAPTTPEEAALDKRVNRKLDGVIITICAIGFLLQNIDKGNVGNASTRSFAKDAHLGKNDVANSISLLSATFVTLQPLSTALGRRFGPKFWIPAMMFCWGSACLAHAFITSRAHLLTLRLLLGAFEAGFVPVCFYYLGTLYPHYMLALRLGMFGSMFAIAGAFSGLLAYAIFHLKSARYKDWQLLFLIEGGATLLMAAVTCLVLPRTLGTAWFLTAEERAHAVRRLEIDNPNIDEHGNPVEDDGRITLPNIKDALTDWKKLITIACNICATLPVYVFGVFMPLIVKGMGYSGLDANLMSVSPFLVAACGLFIFVYLSDRLHERSLFMCLAMAVSLTGFIVLTSSKNNRLRYAFVHVALAGAGTAAPLMAAWLTDNTPDRGTRSIIIGLNGWSNLSGVIAGQVFKERYAPAYRFPLTVTMVMVAVGMTGFFGMRWVLVAVNRRRAAVTAGWTEEQREAERRSLVRRGDRKLTFVYGY
ncbi:MFS general substrate transporter [Trichodelitschia bisporula]|uniref:MFS general substrate transporter n=1 Tax=Trichodelitschia bisporula TaxID=703511 RepID=A0A6G1I967_9PEZI|nr:MFS general substrate transporter [Trichodelitschia bisporula]